MKEQLKAIARNPWVQRGAIIAPLLFGASCARPEEEPMVSPVLPTATVRAGEPQASTPRLTPTETPKQVERPVEEGKVRIRSINYPHQIDIPLSWQPSTMEVGGKKVDVFFRDTIADFRINVNVLAEPVNSWVTLQDYAMAQLGQLRQNTSEAFQLPGSPGAPLEAETGASSVLLNIPKVRVGGKDTIVLLSKVPKGLFNPALEAQTVIFLHEGRAWQITLTHPIYPSYLTEAQYTTIYKEFRRMLESFRFLSSK